VAPDQYVIVDEKEIENLKPERGRTIEIEQFVDIGEIDPVYFNRVYYVSPAEGAAKPYRLLVEAMKQSGKAAVAHFTFHERQHLVILRTVDDGIVMHTLHYADEVLPLADVLPGTVDKAKVTKQELDVAEKLIEALSRPLDVAQFRDQYREQLTALIDAKSQGKTVRVADDHADEPAPRTINLMEALKKSLAQNRATASRGTNGRSHAPRRKSA
jgi:DNA end-binding protein Ku